MTFPLVHLVQINTKKNVKLNNNDEQSIDSEQERKLNHLIYQFNQLKHMNYGLIFYNAIVSCYGLLLLLVITWFLTSSGYHVSILQTFQIKSCEDIITKSIRVYTDSVLMNMVCYNIPRHLRFDCHPENGASELECTNRGCCWDTTDRLDNLDMEKIPLNIPYCFYPSDWKLYESINQTQKGNDAISYFKKNHVNSFYKKDLPLIKMDSVSIDESTLRVKIYDPTSVRHEPMFPIRKDPKPFDNDVKNAKYKFNRDESNIGRPGFRITRQLSNENTVIFDSTQSGGFIFADQFLQMSVLLPSSNIYGLGEHRTNLKLNINWQILTFFNKDQPPTENANLYGSHPFYLVIENTGNCHGVLLLNSNAMDIILQPTPALTYRSIGGIFDFYFFMGPTPADVLRQYSEIVHKPFLPPYWSLGFHLCRFGYGSLNKTIEVWNRTCSAGIPFDTQWNDLDYMDHANDFTYNKNNFKDLPKFVDQLHKHGMHYIPLIDPGVSASEKNGTYPPYDNGLQRNIFIQDGNTGQPFIGKVWNRVSTVWPDFTHTDAYDYWHALMNKMHDNFAYDGAWIDMNEPSNFYNGRINGCTPNLLDFPPYVPNVIGNLLSTKTLCMNAKHYLGYHYDYHNMYAIYEASVTHKALMNIRHKRPFIVSRASWTGQGTYSAVWTGDIYSSWHDLKMSVSEILSYSLFQIPMIGADICGFDGNTTESLCNRWMQLGAFYPFSRNHNSDDTIEQDPVAMGDLVVKSSKKALTIRYRFLPYLYTLFYRASVYGDTVARPLFVEFYNDTSTWNIDTQFLWGSAFMIIPVLNENETQVTGYLPHGYWYNYYAKERIISTGKNFTFDAPLDTIPIVIRGGYILPAQKPALTSTASRKNKYELIIALNESGQAYGELYWDDGDSLNSIEKQEYRWVEFKLDKKKMIMNDLALNILEKDFVFGLVEIMGVTENVSWVKVNGEHVSFEYDTLLLYLKIHDMPTNFGGKFVLEWH